MPPHARVSGRQGQGRQAPPGHLQRASTRWVRRTGPERLGWCLMPAHHQQQHHQQQQLQLGLSPWGCCHQRALVQVQEQVLPQQV